MVFENREIHPNYKQPYHTSSQDKGKEWPLFVTSCSFAMNTFVSTTTGFSPYELVLSEETSRHT